MSEARLHREPEGGEPRYILAAVEVDRLVDEVERLRAVAEAAYRWHELANVDWTDKSTAVQFTEARRALDVALAAAGYEVSE